MIAHDASPADGGTVFIGVFVGADIRRFTIADRWEFTPKASPACPWASVSARRWYLETTVAARGVEIASRRRDQNGSLGSMSLHSSLVALFLRCSGNSIGTSPLPLISNLPPEWLQGTQHPGNLAQRSIWRVKALSSLSACTHVFSEADLSIFARWPASGAGCFHGSARVGGGHCPPARSAALNHPGFPSPRRFFEEAYGIQTNTALVAAGLVVFGWVLLAMAP